MPPAPFRGVEEGGKGKMRKGKKPNLLEIFLQRRKTGERGEERKEASKYTLRRLSNSKAKEK